MKKAICLALALTLTLAMGACGSPQADTAPTEGEAPAAAENSSGSEAAASGGGSSDITLRFVKAGTETEQRAFYETILPRFTEATGIEVVYEDAGWDDIDTKLNMAFASGQAPDVIRYAISSVAQRATMGQYEDITDRLAAWSGKDDLMESAITSGEYLGRNYGIGVFVGHAFMIWRKDYFEEAGLDPDTPPTTHEELLEYARKLTVIEGGQVVRSGVSIPTGGNAHHHVLPIVMQQGVEPVDYENNMPIFNDPAYVYALDFFTGFQREGLLMPYTFMNDTAPILQDKTAICIQGSSVDYNNLLDTFPELEGKIGVALQPFYGDIKASFGGSQMLFLSSDSQYKEEAWQLMEFMLEPEQIWTQFEVEKTPPVLKSLREQYIAEQPEINEVILDAMEIMVGNPKVTWAPLYIKYLQQAYEQAMYDEKTVEQALADAQNALLEELSES